MDKALKCIEPFKTPFDGTPDCLGVFLIKVKGRVKVASWQEICQYADVDDTTTNLSKDHTKFIHKNQKDVHNARMDDNKNMKVEEFFQFLFGSLTEDFQNELINDLKIKDGPLAYKVIIKLISPATVFSINT